MLMHNIVMIMMQPLLTFPLRCPVFTGRLNCSSSRRSIVPGNGMYPDSIKVVEAEDEVEEGAVEGVVRMVSISVRMEVIP